MSAFFAVLLGGVARAEPPPGAPAASEAIRLEYVAPPGCGDRDAFYDALRGRTDRVRLSQGDARDRLFSVRVTRSPSGYEGRLAVFEPIDGNAGEPVQSTERLLSAESCAEVVEALSIVAALAMDANAGRAGADAAVPLPSAAPPAQEPPPGPPPTIPSATPPVIDSPPTTRLPPIDSPGVPLSWFVGASVGVDLVEPSTVVFPTGGLSFELGLERSSLFSPSARVALRRSLEATVASQSGEAAFVLTAARVEACPIRFEWHRAVRLLPCAVFDGGALSAEGRGVSGGQSHLRPWWTVGAAARVSVGASSLRAELEAGAVVPLVSDQFQFAPDEKIYKVSGIAPFFAVGVSLGEVNGTLK